MYCSCHKSQVVLGLALLLFAQAALAGSFGVSPIRLTLSAERTSQMVTVRNTGEEETLVQVQPNAWLLSEGADLLEPSAELIAVPPLFSLAPGGSQVVRIGLRRAPVPGRELTYRLLLREVPPPPSDEFFGLQVALELSVPVFVLPPGGAGPNLDWQLAHNADGALELRAHNAGNAHVQLQKARLESTDGRVIESPDLSAYLLPGQSRAWPLAGQAAVGSRWTLAAKTDAGELETELVIETD
jgi:fimbrial chaperone protein